MYQIVRNRIFPENGELQSCHPTVFKSLMIIQNLSKRDNASKLLPPPPPMCPTPFFKQLGYFGVTDLGPKEEFFRNSKRMCHSA